MAQIVGLKMSTPRLWGLMMSITGLIAVAGLFLTPMLVESPEWLAGKGKRNKTIRALIALRGCTTSEASNELSTKLTDGSRAPREAAPAMSTWEIIKNPLLQKPLIVACFIQMSQQLSGINAVSELLLPQTFVLVYIETCICHRSSLHSFTYCL